MIKKFVYWLYLRVVYLPELKKTIRETYPGARISVNIKDLDRSGFINKDTETKVRQVQKAQWEREWIPDDELN